MVADPTQPNGDDVTERTNDLVVVSNRGPVTWHSGDEGELVPTRGAGGLVTALGGALQQESGTWVSVALGDGDAEMARRHEDKPFEVDTGDGTYRVRLIDVGERFDAYYNEVSNRLLWFTLHTLWGAPYEPVGIGWRTEWHYGYEAVNEAVADAVGDEAAGGAEVYLQDYHLCLAGRAIRASLPDARLLHYVHTPWVGPDYLSLLPDPIAHGVLRGLLAADVVAFSSPAWCRAFRRCAAEILGADVQGESVLLDGRRTVVADFVLGVDEAALNEVATSDAALRAAAELDAQRNDRRLLLRAERTDLSKNILRGLQAYELLLERRPEHRGQVWHYLLLNPSRQSVQEYRAYLDACRQAAARIQERFGEDCLTLDVTGDYPRVVAAMQRYDVLLTNPIIDGTNLVAKEGPSVNERDGVLVLSANAGAATVMGEAALLVNPYDVEAQADALDQALTMDAEERSTRASGLRAAARLGSPADWFEAQRHLLRATVARRR